jgi:hypothetical protein
MTKNTMIVVHPAAEDAVKTIRIAPRLPSLQNIALGVIDNSKHMAAPLLRAIEKELETRYGVRTQLRYKKANASVPTPPEKLAEFIASCDAVIHGVAD